MFHTVSQEIEFRFVLSTHFIQHVMRIFPKAQSEIWWLSQNCCLLYHDSDESRVRLSIEYHEFVHNTYFSILHFISSSSFWSQVTLCHCIDCIQVIYHSVGILIMTVGQTKLNKITLVKYIFLCFFSLVLFICCHCDQFHEFSQKKIVEK